MTAIAGFVHEGRVWIGGDSAGVSGYALTQRADEKVFRNSEFLFGFTSSFRMGQILRYKFTPPGLKEHQDVFSFMCSEFIDEVRQCLRTGGFAERQNDAEYGGTFLVGFRGRLFCVESDYQVAESLCGYMSCGCGRDVANGALYATHGLPPETRMKIVMDACEKHSAGVRGPFTVMAI